MTRNLRKRHLAVWLVLLFTMIFCLAYAINNRPVFAGDRNQTSNVQ